MLHNKILKRNIKKGKREKKNQRSPGSLHFITFNSFLYFFLSSSTLKLSLFPRFSSAFLFLFSTEKMPTAFFFFALQNGRTPFMRNLLSSYNLKVACPIVCDRHPMPLFFFYLENRHVAVSSGVKREA